MTSAMVSTIIPVRNRPDLLRQAVESVLDQTYRPIEVIIVDDASTDETPALIAGLVQDHPDTIRTLKGMGNGPGPARETGRRQARGEFIQYLDSDDLLHPGKFELQVDALNKNPSADIAYGITRFVDSGRTVLNDCLKWSGQSREFLYPGLLVDRWWSTHTPLWRKTLCDRMGPWSSLRYSEDWEYEARAGALKARLVHVPQVVCDVRQHEGTRETGAGRWLSPIDQVRFFDALYAGAVAADVSPACQEMRHFVRWVFTAARSAARQHEAGVAAQLLSLAETASARPSRQLLMYRRLSNLMGWHTLAVVSEWLCHMLRRHPHKDALRQSWMADDCPVRREG